MGIYRINNNIKVLLFVSSCRDLTWMATLRTHTASLLQSMRSAYYASPYQSRCSAEIYKETRNKSGASLEEDQRYAVKTKRKMGQSLPKRISKDLEIHLIAYVERYPPCPYEKRFSSGGWRFGCGHTYALKKMISYLHGRE